MSTLSERITTAANAVSNGKSLIANAITNKGIDTSSTASFSTMANNINSIMSANSGIPVLDIQLQYGESSMIGSPIRDVTFKYRMNSTINNYIQLFPLIQNYVQYIPTLNYIKVSMSSESVPTVGFKMDPYFNSYFDNNYSSEPYNIKCNEPTESFGGITLTYGSGCMSVGGLLANPEDGWQGGVIFSESTYSIYLNGSIFFNTDITTSMISDDLVDTLSDAGVSTTNVTVSTTKEI